MCGKSFSGCTRATEVFVILWEFRIKTGAEETFLAGYRSEGAWVQLFRRGAGFVETKLARDMQDTAVFYTLDCWKSEGAYEEFRAAFQQEYEVLDQKFAGLTEQERLIGVFQTPIPAR